jgi:hypothetical protein
MTTLGGDSMKLVKVLTYLIGVLGLVIILVISVLLGILFSFIDDREA